MGQNLTETLEKSTDAARATALLRDLVAAQREGEAAVQALISTRLTDSGCSVRAVDYEPATVPVRGEFASQEAGSTGQRSAIIGELPGDPDLPSLLMFAHPDGEPVAGTERWTHDPFGGEVENGRLYGWGIADDLAGCAAAVLRRPASATPAGWPRCCIRGCRPMPRSISTRPKAAWACARSRPSPPASWNSPSP